MSIAVMLMRMLRRPLRGTLCDRMGHAMGSTDTPMMIMPGLCCPQYGRIGSRSATAGGLGPGTSADLVDCVGFF
jgi:hypothetical protein